MKKFKNKFGVTGPESLLKAFVEEIEKIGWKKQPHHQLQFNRGLVYLNGTNKDGDLKPGHYWTADGADNPLKLPQDWNQAIKLAKETVEEKPKFKKGEWYYFNDGTWEGVFQTNEHSNNFIHYSYLLYDDLNSQEINYEEKDRSLNRNWIGSARPATTEEVFRFLKMEAEKRGFVEGKEIKIRWNDGMIDNVHKCQLRFDSEFQEFCNVTPSRVIWNAGEGWIAEVISNDLTFGGCEVSVYKDNGIVYIECKEETGTLNEIKKIMGYIDPQDRLKFGRVSFKGFYSEGYEMSMMYNRTIKEGAVKIGCLTGTWSELKRIVEEGEKLL